MDPEGLSLSACEFEYVPQRQFEETKFASVTAAEKASCSPEAAKVPVDSDYHAVQAEVTGLAQGGTYYYRLSGTTAGSTGGFSESVSLAFTTQAAPRVMTEAAAANLPGKPSGGPSPRIDPLSRRYVLPIRNTAPIWGDFSHEVGELSSPSTRPGGVIARALSDELAAVAARRDVRVARHRTERIRYGAGRSGCRRVRFRNRPLVGDGYRW